MLSAVIPSERSQPAVLLAEQLAHQRFVRPGPLVLGSTLLKSPAPTADRDRTVSRRSKPSSRTALMGEQPNPWDRLQPQDATSRHRTFPAVSSGADYISTLLDQRARGRRVVTVMNLHVAQTATVALRHSRYGVTCGSDLSSLVALPTDFPRYCPPTQSREGEGFTVISRFHYGISAVSPQIEVPNRAVDVNSWAR